MGVLLDFLFIGIIVFLRVPAIVLADFIAVAFLSAFWVYFLSHFVSFVLLLGYKVFGCG